MGSQAAAWLDSFLSEHYLSHEYDPVKAREYYLRTRELKGRAPSAGEPESVARARKAANEAETRQEDVEAQRAALKAALEAKLEELELNLEKLKAAVKTAKMAAMRKAGVSEETLGRMITQEVKAPGSTKGGTELNDGKEPKASSTDSSDRKPKTAEQKRKDAKSAKERYEEEKAKNPNPDQQLEDIQGKVDAAGEQITKMAERLEALKRLGEKK